MPKVLRPETFLPASYPLVGVVTVAAPPDAPGVDHAGRGVWRAPLFSRTMGPQSVADRLPGASRDQATW